MQNQRLIDKLTNNHKEIKDLITVFKREKHWAYDWALGGEQEEQA